MLCWKPKICSLPLHLAELWLNRGCCSGSGIPAGRDSQAREQSRQLGLDLPPKQLCAADSGVLVLSILVRRGAIWAGWQNGEYPKTVFALALACFGVCLAGSSGRTTLPC